MSNIKVHSESFEPPRVGGRRKRFDIGELLQSAEDNAPAWVSTTLPTKDADSACRQLKTYVNVSHTSQKADEDSRRVFVRVVG